MSTIEKLKEDLEAIKNDPASPPSLKAFAADVIAVESEQADKIGALEAAVAPVPPVEPPPAEEPPVEEPPVDLPPPPVEEPPAPPVEEPPPVEPEPPVEVPPPAEEPPVEPAPLAEFPSREEILAAVAAGPESELAMDAKVLAVYALIKQGK